jgi:lipoprotein-releasing system ATP-binding protein
VLGAFLALVRGEGSAALIATHNRALAARMDRVVRLDHGMLHEGNGAGFPQLSAGG